MVIILLAAIGKLHEIDLIDPTTLIDYLCYCFLQITLGIQHVMQYDLVHIDILNIHSFQVSMCFNVIKI